MVSLPTAPRPATPGLFLELEELLGDKELALELGFLGFELADAPVLGILERLATRRLGRQSGFTFVLELRPPDRKLGAVQPLSPQQLAHLAALGTGLGFRDDAPLVLAREAPTQLPIVFGIGHHFGRTLERDRFGHKHSPQRPPIVLLFPQTRVSLIIGTE
ncbi:MAG: hypothetical protein LC799_31925, partial [Actinobacteria bacterium]|nr:hypothetical protein [Actinomycetota bacterium]